MQKTLAIRCAQLVQAIANCEERGNWVWRDKHTENLESIVREHMPSGSGFDAGTTIDLERSTGEKLVFNTSFHHMDDNGAYIYWTDHTVTVRASLVFGITLTIGGRDRRLIKEYIHGFFDSVLSATFIDPAKDKPEDFAAVAIPPAAPFYDPAANTLERMHTRVAKSAADWNKG